ncbi:hypothetical protein [Microcoleus sp. bin38.metabat.b11b12b14.051]|uniref:hypothetical protein n=1 Tax=Microcoleus sp. bin38.metabat.b11b12b14.051 TaxID=2742709 RepID=UPI0025CD4EAB|nr:hypothetical protein [Microcoleus sp. bin38.metabat.b11b12b14.051]
MTINRVMLKGISIDTIVTGCPLACASAIAGNLSTGALFGDRTISARPWIFGNKIKKR